MTWLPAPLTPADAAAAVAETVAPDPDPWAGHLTSDDERVWR